MENCKDGVSRGEENVPQQRSQKRKRHQEEGQVNQIKPYLTCFKLSRNRFDNLVPCRDNAGPTNLQMHSKMALGTRKFSFHQPSSDLSFSKVVVEEDSIHFEVRAL